MGDLEPPIFPTWALSQLTGLQTPGPHLLPPSLISALCVVLSWDGSYWGKSTVLCPGRFPDTGKVRVRCTHCPNILLPLPTWLAAPPCFEPVTARASLRPSGTRLCAPVWRLQEAWGSPAPLKGPMLSVSQDFTGPLHQFANLTPQGLLQPPDHLPLVWSLKGLKSGWVLGGTKGRGYLDLCR